MKEVTYELRYRIAQEILADDLGGKPGDYAPAEYFVESNYVDVVMKRCHKEEHEWLVNNINRPIHKLSNP